jgi:hypothetical protein
MKASASLFLWTLRDAVITVAAVILGVLLLTQTGSVILLSAAAVYAFLSIRFEDTSILDYIKYAYRFCAAKPQFYLWRWPA